MRRNKRSLQQVQQIAKMKIAVIQQQKQDLVDTLNDFTTLVLTEAEQALVEEGGSQAKYQATLMQLDKVSQVFTSLATHIDSILYVDEECRDEKKINATGDSNDFLPVSKKAQQQKVCGNSVRQTGETGKLSSNYAEETPSKTQQTTQVDSLESQALSNPPQDATHDEVTQGQLFNMMAQPGDPEGHFSDCRETRSHGLASRGGRTMSIDFPKENGMSNTDRKLISLENTDDTPEGRISTKTSEKMKGDKGDITGVSSQSDSVSPQTRSPSVHLEISDSDPAKPQPSTGMMNEWTTNQDQQPTGSHGDAGPSLFLPTNSLPRQPSFQSSVPQELLIPGGRRECPSPLALPVPTGWAQPPPNQVEHVNFAPAGLNRAVPLLNTADLRYAANNLGFPLYSPPENANFFVGQSLYHQPAFVNNRCIATPSHQGGHYNMALLGQPLVSVARTNSLPHMGVGHFPSSRLGVLVQSPAITTAPPSPEIDNHSVQIRETNSGSSRGSPGSPSPLSNEATSVSSQLSSDEKPPGLSKNNNTLNRKEYKEFRQYTCSEYSATSQRGSKRLASSVASCEEKTPKSDSSFPELPVPSDMENEASAVKNSSHVPEKGWTQASSPTLSDTSVSSRLRPSPSAKRTQPSFLRKPKKLMDLPDDLKDIIKQAKQEEKDKMLPTSNAETPKVVDGPKIEQVQLKKDEINVVSISNVEDPWAFHAQLTYLMPEISLGIQEALEGGCLESLAPKQGLLCLAKFRDGKYYRARIEQHVDMGDFPPRIQVSYVDYGNKHWVSASDLYQLPGTLLKQPAQAVLCALAKVSPAIDDWTEQATRLVRQLTQNGYVQMRVIRPPKKRHRTCSSSSGICPSSPETEHPNQWIPTSTNTSYHWPYLVDIISKHGKGGQAVSVSSALVKAGHAQTTEIDSQVEALTKLNAPSDDRRLQELQQMMLNMQTAKSGQKDKAVGDKTPVVSEPSCVSAQRKRIPACLQVTKIKGARSISKSFLSKAACDEALRRPGGLGAVRQAARENDKLSQKSDKDSEGSLESTELTHALGIEVDRRLRDLGLSVKETKKQRNCESSLDFEEKEGEENGEEIEEEVTVVSAISPSSFFVHRVTEHSTLNWLVEKLNKTFAGISDQVKSLKSDTFTPQRHMLCCAVFSQDGCYYRGLVLEVSTDVVLILFIDFGDFEWVPRSKVFPLSQELQSVPPVALWCSLKGVVPLESDQPHSVDKRWSEEATNTFKAFVKECKLFHMFLPKSAQYEIEGRESFQRGTFEVFLVYQSETQEQDPEEICVNLELINLGLAALEHPSIAPSEISREVEEEPDLADWNPLLDEFESHRNSYKINTDDPGVALVGYEAGNVGPTGQRICVHYNRPKGCFKGDNCPNLHIKAPRDGLSHDLASVRVYDQDQSALLPKEGSLVVVTVSTVVTPGKFYVTLPWGRLTAQEVAGQSEALQRFQAEESLEGLTDNMQYFYAHKRYNGDLTVPALGQAMAAQVNGRWIRAMVVDSNVEKGRVQVVSVDFGWHAWVDETALRDLELRFFHLAPQAVHCALATVEPHPGHGHKWADGACKHFADLVFGRSLIAYVKEREPSGRLSVNLYDTSGPEDVDINQALVDAGWAIKVDPDQNSQSQAQDSVSPSSNQTDSISMAPA